MASVRRLELEKNSIFVKFSCSEWKFAPVYQVWSKSDNLRLTYGDKAIFKMAAVRHLEFAKIADFVTWPISACDPSSLFQISRWSANMALRYSQKRFSIWRPSAILNLQNFDFLLNDHHHGNCNLHLPTKFDRNRIILGSDIEIMLFSKWRPSAILNLRKLQIWSRDVYRHVILHLCSKFRVDRPIRRRDIAKKRFSIWRPSAILNLQNFDFLLNDHHGNCNLHLPTKFDRNRIILGSDMEIMLFSKWRRPPSWICENCRFGHVTYIGMWSFTSVPNFALIGQYGAEI